MSSAAPKAPVPTDPLLRAMARARSGAPLSDEERQAKEEAMAGSWVEGEEMSAEIARRCAGE
jgi:hypothetical protein